jgi:hypothetical protein
MSLFNSILEKLGLGGSAKATTGPGAGRGATAARGATAGRGTTAAKAPQAAPTSTPAAPAAGAPAAIPVVDVMSKLEGLAAANTQRLNWKTSIVDLLKLLGLDSSFGARKTLATELGCPAEKMSDSAQMNIWLHKTVLQKLAENGGNIPKELLD